MTDPNTPRNEDEDEMLPPAEGAEEENADEIGLAAERSKYGYLCVEGMELGTGDERADAATGELVPERLAVLPSHYKCPQTGAVLPVENPAVWVYREEDLA